MSPFEQNIWLVVSFECWHSAWEIEYGKGDLSSICITNINISFPLFFLSNFQLLPLLQSWLPIKADKFTRNGTTYVRTTEYTLQLWRKFIHYIQSHSLNEFEKDQTTNLVVLKTNFWSEIQATQIRVSTCKWNSNKYEMRISNHFFFLSQFKFFFHCNVNHLQHFGIEHAWMLSVADW